MLELFLALANFPQLTWVTHFLDRVNLCNRCKITYKLVGVQGQCDGRIDEALEKYPDLK